jgi:cytochrome b involved in lipid metabolism
MVASDEKITHEALASHNRSDDLWIAVSGRGNHHAIRSRSEYATLIFEHPVYDLTDFASDHPGGSDVLNDCAGLDGTESYEYAGHSHANLVRMQKFLVGILLNFDGSTPEIAPIGRKAKESKPNNEITADPPNKTQGNGTTARDAKQRGLFALGGLVATTLLYMYSRSKMSPSLPWSNKGIWSASHHLTTSLHSVLGQLDFGDHNKSHAFWYGLILASLASFAVFGYLYKLFASTLVYNNEVFAYPSTIPRKRKQHDHRVNPVLPIV